MVLLTAPRIILLGQNEELTSLRLSQLPLGLGAPLWGPHSPV